MEQAMRARERGGVCGGDCAGVCVHVCEGGVCVRRCAGVCVWVWLRVGQCEVTGARVLVYA